MLSIYILTSNYGHYLKECLESVYINPAFRRSNGFMWTMAMDHSNKVIEPYRHLFRQILVNETPQGLINQPTKPFERQQELMSCD